MRVGNLGVCVLVVLALRRRLKKTLFSFTITCEFVFHCQLWPYFIYLVIFFLNSVFREGNSSEDVEDFDLNSAEREGEYSRRFSLGK